MKLDQATFILEHVRPDAIDFLRGADRYRITQIRTDSTTDFMGLHRAEITIVAVPDDAADDRNIADAIDRLTAQTVRANGLAALTLAQTMREDTRGGIDYQSGRARDLVDLADAITIAQASDLAKRLADRIKR